MEKEEKISQRIGEIYDVKVEKVMSKDFPQIEENASILEVMRKIGGLEVYHLWVVDSTENNKLVGVTTEEDILYALEEPQNDLLIGGDMLGLGSLLYGTATMEDIMVSSPITCSKQSTLDEVMKMMVKRRINQMPVVEEEKIVGEVTLNEILHFVAKKIKR